jgi:hypothetical protein
MALVSVLTSTMPPSVGGQVSTVDPNGCTITWITNPQTSAVNAVQLSNITYPTSDSCQQYCINYGPCTAAEWNSVSTINFYGCWIHNTTLGTLYQNTGVTQYIISRSNCAVTTTVPTTTIVTTTPAISYVTVWINGTYINGTWINGTYVNVTYYQSGSSTVWGPVLSAAGTLDSFLTTGIMTIAVIIAATWMSAIDRS